MLTRIKLNLGSRHLAFQYDAKLIPLTINRTRKSNASKSPMPQVHYAAATWPPVTSSSPTAGAINWPIAEVVCAARGDRRIRRRGPSNASMLGSGAGLAPADMGAAADRRLAAGPGERAAGWRGGARRHGVERGAVWWRPGRLRLSSGRRQLTALNTVGSCPVSLGKIYSGKWTAIFIDYKN